MAITFGNPIVITSGTLNTKIFDGSIKIESIYWNQPTLESTSSLVITKLNAAGVTFIDMKCETSGESQVLPVVQGGWMRHPYCRCVPTGTLYIYCE